MYVFQHTHKKQNKNSMYEQAYGKQKTNFAANRNQKTEIKTYNQNTRKSTTRLNDGLQVSFKP